MRAAESAASMGCPGLLHRGDFPAVGADARRIGLALLVDAVESLGVTNGDVQNAFRESLATVDALLPLDLCVTCLRIYLAACAVTAGGATAPIDRPATLEELRADLLHMAGGHQ